MFLFRHKDARNFIGHTMLGTFKYFPKFMRKYDSIYQIFMKFLTQLNFSASWVKVLLISMGFLSTLLESIVKGTCRQYECMHTGSFAQKSKFLSNYGQFMYHFKKVAILTEICEDYLFFNTKNINGEIGLYFGNNEKNY